MSTLTIQLPEEKLERLQKAATARQQSPNVLVEEALDAYLPPLPVALPEGASLVDVLHDYIGAIDGPPTDASRISEVFGEILEEKHREGRL